MCWSNAIQGALTGPHIDNDTFNCLCKPGWYADPDHGTCKRCHDFCTDCVPPANQGDPADLSRCIECHPQA
jgi:hypothetical protein